jgi:hypothetical protein
MTSTRGTLVVVAQDGDRLARRVKEIVDARGGRTRWCAPARRASLSVALTDETFTVEDDTVGAILWRVSPDMPLADDFREEDRAFAAAETAAVWIAGNCLRGTLAVNRFDAEAWYSGLRWHYWRDRLAASGVAVTDICVGDLALPSDWQWSPYTTGEPCDLPEGPARAVMACACHDAVTLVTSIAVCGDITAASPHPNVRRTAELLDAWGVGLAAIDADPGGRVHRVRVLPALEDSPLAEHVALTLGDRLYEHCAAR